MTKNLYITTYQYNEISYKKQCIIKDAYEFRPSSSSPKRATNTMGVIKHYITLGTDTYYLSSTGVT